MKKAAIAIAVFLLTFGLNAQTFDKAKMDSLFKRIESNEKGMGSISIFKNGNEIYQNSFGFADIENDIQATEKTKYRIGSVSKTFTATIIMQLIDEKKLSLETKLADFYPEIPNASKITIEQLLRHRSGLYNFTNSEDYQNWMEKPLSKSEAIKKFIENGTVFKPDEKAEYSNTNYVLLSFIAEKTEQKEFSEILNKRIIEPCNLKNTYYGGKINTAENEALSYTKTYSWNLSTETDMSVPVGAGAIVSNPTDLNIFYNHLFTGKLVSKNSLQEMMNIIDDYGIGMFQLFHQKAYGHTGGIDGFQSTASYFPKDSTLIAYISNGVAMPKRDITVGALKIYYNEEYTLPELKPGLKLKSEDLDQYLGVYSSSTNPLKITISKDSTVLIAQATGQSSFPMEAYELHKFKFEFIPEENKMILKQGEGEFELIREEEADKLIDSELMIIVPESQLYVRLRGNTDKPLIINLHGGPGGYSGIDIKLMGPYLEEHFLIAYLDQRGCGKSMHCSDTSMLTIEQYIKDLDIVIDSLMNRYNKQSVNLMGTSWGGMYGFLYMLSHEEKVKSYACIDGKVNSHYQNHSLIDLELRKAKELLQTSISKEQKNELEHIVSELMRIKNSNFAHFHKDVNWMKHEVPPKLGFNAYFADTSKIISLNDVLQDTSLLKLMKYSKDEYLQVGEKAEIVNRAFRNNPGYNIINIEQDLIKITTPTIIIQGDKDYVVGTGQAELIYNALSGLSDENKELHILPNTGHCPAIESPEILSGILIVFFEKHCY